MKLFVTPQCSLACVYCRKDKRLKAPELSELLEKVSRAEGKLSLRGGDPLISLYILDILKYAKSRNLKVDVDTPGVFLTQEALEYIDTLSFPFDSVNFESWRKITGKGKPEYDACVNAIFLARDSGKKVYVDLLLTKLSISTLCETRDFCKKNGLSFRVLENNSKKDFEDMDWMNLPLKSATDILGDGVEYVEASNEPSISEPYYRRRR